MKWLRIAALFIIILTLASCAPSPAGEPIDPSDDGYVWSRITGPNGQECIVLSRWIGYRGGVMAMDCKWE